MESVTSLANENRLICLKNQYQNEMLRKCSL